MTLPRGAPSRKLWYAAREIATKDECKRLFYYEPCSTCFDLLWLEGPGVYGIPTESGWPELATHVCETCDLSLCEAHAGDHDEDKHSTFQRDPRLEETDGLR